MKNVQRRLNSSQPTEGLARTGAPKLTQDTFAPVPGQKRATEGELHPYLHGQAVDDAVPVKSYAGPDKQVPIHPGTRARPGQLSYAIPDAHNASAILKEAKTLGPK
jgi:hypothetical protein